MEDIPYTVIRKKRRTASIIVRPDSSVEVHVPLRLAEKHVREMVREKSRWILRKRREAVEQIGKFPPHEYREGETFYYLGRKILLRISRGTGRGVEVLDRELIVHVPLKGDVDVRKRVVRFFHTAALSAIRSRVIFYSSKLGLHPGPVRVRNMKSRWGSCSSSGALTFNVRLAMAPMSVIDYVVVHELCHLKEANHSQAFWALVEAAMPAYRREKDWLRKHGRSVEL